MVDSSQPQKLILNSSETAYSFPPHRRRPLRSRTYDVFMQILSHCHTGSSQLKLQGSGKEGSITHNEAKADVIESFPNKEGSKDMILQEDSNDENKENTGVQDGGFDGRQATIPELHHAKLVSDGEPEVAPSNRISVEDYMAVENVMGDYAVQNAYEQENLNSVLEFQTVDFEVDKEFCINNFNEISESCFGMDDKSPKRQETRHKGSLLENLPKDAEQELLLKEMELEKLIDNSGGVESSFRPNADDEMEEGEISGETGVSGESFDVLSDDVASHEKRTAEKIHASEDHFDNEDEGHVPFDRSGVNNSGNSMKMERRAPAGQIQDCLSQNVLYNNHTETQRSGAITPCLENLIPSGRIFQENAVEKQTPSTAESGDCSSKNKRKRRGHITQEKREKKKKSKRLKRAAKNRELGVKRLKLQPVIKEKKIVYCRHYLQGRCHEGDKCNFSHDTVPLTKSKPCSHFARHSCMKGDGCPFDHQLSNYPCTNYASTGFCIRGSDCLFSHEIPAKSCSISPSVSKLDLMSDKGGSDPKSKATKPELKFLSPLNNSNSSKHMDNLRLLHQKVDAIIGPASNSPAKTVPKTVVQPPRGVSFLSIKPTGDTNKEKRDESSPKTPDGVNIGSKSTLQVPGDISQSSKASEGAAAPSKRKGINFLALVKPSPDDSSSRIISKLLYKCNKEAEIADLLSLFNRGAANRQMNASATTNLASGLNEKVNGTPLVEPQRISSLSGNRSCLDDSISKETTSFHFNRSDAASSFGKEKESTSELQGTFKSPSLPFDGQSTGGQNARSPSSYKKSIFYLKASSQVQKAMDTTMEFAARIDKCRSSS